MDSSLLPDIPNAGMQLKRICLFAGYDSDSIVDQYVIDYITELNQYSDVYYLADNSLPDRELDKLRAITRGRWGIPHGKYDFGSYSILALELVGWDVLQEADEVLFVNDSCYLIKPLEEIFKKMMGSDCDWWGLQATKGYFVTKHKKSNCFREQISLDVVKKALPLYFKEPMFDFLLGSYFLCFRENVLKGGVLKRFLESITEQPHKLKIIHEYEVGLTKLLISHNYEFDTYIPKIYPYHPIYSLRHFDLIRNGFPLLKKRLLAVNHYKVAGLSSWKSVISSVNPLLDIDVIERNLIRTVGRQKLNDNLSIENGDTVFKPYPTIVWLTPHFIRLTRRSMKQGIKKLVGQKRITAIKDFIKRISGQKDNLPNL